MERGQTSYFLATTRSEDSPTPLYDQRSSHSRFLDVLKKSPAFCVGFKFRIEAAPAGSPSRKMLVWVSNERQPRLNRASAASATGTFLADHQLAPVLESGINRTALSSIGLDYGDANGEEVRCLKVHLGWMIFWLYSVRKSFIRVEAVPLAHVAGKRTERTNVRLAGIILARSSMKLESRCALPPGAIDMRIYEDMRM